MTAVGTFVMSVCAGALVFSLVMFIVTDNGSGKAVRIAAAAFMLTVILRSVVAAVTEVGDAFTEPNDDVTADAPDGDAYIGMQASLALKSIIAERLNGAGCDYSFLAVDVSYSDGAFTQITVSVTAENTDSANTALQVAKDLGIEFDISVTGKTEEGYS